ncbi:MAG TPA: cell division protein SepF [Nocardioides sp.]|nr:cell division protein SepF [uncultured Nocardioides sp.]HEX5985733.1 cell division protein SepF [Nocardioides sp.]
MGSAMRKMGVYLGLLEDTERYDDDYYDEYDEQPARRDARDARGLRDEARLERVDRLDRAESRPAPVADLTERRRPQPAAQASTVAELSRITTLHPRSYNDARTIGENFREGVPVIMNLSEMDDADAKRLVDFAAGLIFGVRGSIERVTNKVFLLSPPNVTVAAEDKQRIREDGFFNQS